MSKVALERNGTLDNPGVNETLIRDHMNLIPRLLNTMKKVINQRRVNESDPVSISF